MTLLRAVVTFTVLHVRHKAGAKDNRKDTFPYPYYLLHGFQEVRKGLTWPTTTFFLYSRVASSGPLCVYIQALAVEKISSKKFEPFPLAYYTIL